MEAMFSEATRAEIWGILCPLCRCAGLLLALALTVGTVQASRLSSQISQEEERKTGRMRG